MGNIGVVIAIFVLIAFLGGVFIGVIVIASLASRREDDLHSLTGKAPGHACEGARRLTGAHTRGSGFVSSDIRSGGDDSTGPDDDDDAGGDRTPRWPGR